MFVSCCRVFQTENCGMEGNVLEVRFKVQARVRHGEEIRLSGNHPSLGCDNVERSIPLVTSPKEFPWWWNKEAIFVPNNYSSIRYRYAVFSGGKFLRFEGEGQLSRSLNLEFSNDNVHSTCDILDDGPSVPAEPVQPEILISSYSRENRARQFNESGRQSSRSIRLTDSVIVLSYFLPVIVKRDERGNWIAQRNHENILSFETSLRVSWIGSVQIPGINITPEDEEAISLALKPLNCYPVFISKEMHKKFYNGFCKQQLWPIMHHHSEIYGESLRGLDPQAEKHLWFIYTTVNQLFGKKIVEIYQEDDLIWVHGFHLMLLPSFIRRKVNKAKIGFFLHTPFPSSEIWKTLWCREDLLQGILCSDQIGFHLYEYARHFLTACRRVLGTHYEFTSSGVLEINVFGRPVVVTCMHVGVHLDHIQDELYSDEFSAEVKRWESKFESKIVIASIDRLEKLKAIPLKLIGIEQFLTDNPSYVEKIVFVIIGITASERGDDYIQTQASVNILVNRINEKFPQAIYYEERKENEMKLVQRVALFYVSDVLMVTAVRDGLNRLPMEYTLTRSTMKRAPIGNEESNISKGKISCNLVREGVVIMSEFVSSARVMGGAIIINPWKSDEIKEAILRSLEMPQPERTARFRRNLEFCSRMTTLKWAENVLKDLKNVEPVDSSNSSLGLGVNFRFIGIPADFAPLDIVKFTKAYRTSQHRLLLFDWGGTLADSLDTYEAYAIAIGHGKAERSSDDLTQLLQSLCDDPRNYCFVVSGRDIHSLQEYFGSVERLGLAAEHGCYYRFPSKDKDSTNNWTTSIALESRDWMDPVRRIMDIYTQRTHGSYIEQKGSAMIWQFRDADPDFGFLQSKELEEHLSDILSTHPLEIIRGGGLNDGYLEIRPAGLSKGLFLSHILSLLKSKGINVDFLLAIGDDITDEPMFEAANRYSVTKKSSWPHTTSSPANPISTPKIESFTVTVGKKASSALSYLNDSSEVIGLLRALKKITAYDKRYLSAVDLSIHQKSNLEDITRSNLSSYFSHAAVLTTSSPFGASIPRSNSESQVHALSPRPSFVSSIADHPQTVETVSPAASIPQLNPDFSNGYSIGDDIEEGNEDDEDGNFF